MSAGQRPVKQLVHCVDMSQHTQLMFQSSGRSKMGRTKMWFHFRQQRAVQCVWEDIQLQRDA